VLFELLIELDKKLVMKKKFEALDFGEVSNLIYTKCKANDIDEHISVNPIKDRPTVTVGKLTLSNYGD
jgi:hypothetical protein